MVNYIPSIFNDVIGPIMRGPSSSHCAAAARIGLIARALMNNNPESVRVEFDRAGALATTHTSQGSDMGLCAGILRFDLSDERLRFYREEIHKAGIQVQFKTGSYGDSHPNTYRIQLKNANEQHSVKALSTGGGMIEVVEIDNHELSILGDSYETLVYFNKNEEKLVSIIEAFLGEESDIRIFKGRKNIDKGFICIKTDAPLDDDSIDTISSRDEVDTVRILPPVLSILTPKKIKIPFRSCEQMLVYNKSKRLNLAELAIEYESTRGGISKDAVVEKMIKIARIIKESIKKGLAGTDYEDRILGCQSILYDEKNKSGQLLDLGILNTVITYVTALMEVKSAMGVIVAAPTAGACGGLPGAILGSGDAMGSDEVETAKALLAAGMIGIFIATHSTFAAEVAGCQAECGAGSGMAAAAVVTLMGGTVEKAVSAASMALQNSLGMICDPVANRVEVPCLGKNIMAASNAVSCANMAMAGYDPVIPLDEVIHTMDKVGKSIPFELRCTALGGLSVTETSKKIKETLEKANPEYETA